MKQSAFERTILSVAVALVAGMAAQPADAAFRLRLDSGGEGTVITGVSSEINVNPISVGQFSITGIVGDTATSPNGGALNLSGQISTQTAGSLQISFQNTGFTSPVSPTAGLLLADVTGSLNGPSGSTATFTSFVNTMNAVPALGADQPVGAIGAIGGNPAGSIEVSSFSFNVNGNPPPVVTVGSGNVGFVNMMGPYSLFSQVTIMFTGAGSANFGFNAQTVPVPLPSTLLLTLIGAPMIGLVRRRAARAKTFA